MPEKNPLEGVSLDQLDLSDKETRDYVSKYVDMSDPETAAYFKTFEKPADVPMMGGADGIVMPRHGSTTKTTWDDRLREAQGVRPGLDPENEFGGPRFFENGLPNPFSTVRDIVDVGARGLEYLGAGINTGLDLLDTASEKSGLADALSVGGNKFLPGSAIGALGEAFPLGGAEAGIANPAASAVSRLSPELEKAYIAVSKTGTPEDIVDFTTQVGHPMSLEDAQSFVAKREAAGGRTQDTVTYQQQELPFEAQPSLPFDKKPEQLLEEKLQTEAKNFKTESPQEDLPDFRQRELPLEKPYHQQSFDFGEDAPKQKAINSRDTGEVISSEVKAGVDHINKITDGWENAPSIEVFDNFDKDPDLDPDAIGVTRPDGSVAVSMKNVLAEAERAKVDPEDVLSAVTYHESLGHYGLSQRFGDGLDRFMEGLYNNSTKFKADVDAWRKNNPDDYADDINPLARASEEVLAKMSENGRIAPTLMNRLRNYVKGIGREMGLQLKYSDREIKSILGMAHDAVINGKGRDVSLNDFRYMKGGSFGESPNGTRQGRMSQTDPERADERTIIPNYTGKRNVEDILRDVSPEKTRESWAEWIDEAGNFKNQGNVAKSLATGAEPPELLAAEQYLLKSANRISDLQRKVADGTASEREQYLFEKELERASTVAKNIDDVVSNAARLLNARKIEIATDKSLSDGIRNMMSSLKPEDLKDPDKLKAIAGRLEKVEKHDKRIEAYRKTLEVSANLLGIPRSIMSSVDLSAPLRQGLMLIGTKAYWKNLLPMFKYAFNDSSYVSAMKSIEQSPNYSLMKRGGLAVDVTEEAFPSAWADRIWGIKHPVRGSERAYNGFLSKLRADTFDQYVKMYNDAGIDLAHDSKALKDVAKYINSATGRGSIGRLDHAAPLLSSVLFSPRLMASRIDLLSRSLRPSTYLELSPIVRKQYFKNMLAVGSLAYVTTKIAKELFGADVEDDPRSSDFAKIKVNNTRYDILGGFGQYITLAARLSTNEKKNAKGEVVELGSRPGAPNALEVLYDFMTNKAAPIAGIGADYLRGKTAIGEPVTAEGELASHAIPLFLQDAYDVYKEEGVKGIPMSIPGIFGVGLQTYDPHLGYDAYGRDLKQLLHEDVEETNPTILEVGRLHDDAGYTGLPEAPSKFSDDGEKFELSQEEKDQWQRRMGEYTLQYLTEDMSTNEYLIGADEERIEVVKKAHRDAYEDAKADYFTDRGDQ